MERMIEFLNTLNTSEATIVEANYLAIAIGASRQGFIDLELGKDDLILAKLTAQGAKFIQQQAKSEMRFPTLLEHKPTGCIVLASNPNCGTVLVSDGSDNVFPMGLFRMDWTDFNNITIWQPLEQGDVVTLTQES